MAHIKLSVQTNEFEQDKGQTLACMEVALVNIKAPL